MNILEFINCEDVQEEIRHDPIKMKDIIEVPAVLKNPTVSTDLTQYNNAIKNTCGLLIIAPLVLIYAFAQKFIIQGIERSGITG